MPDPSQALTREIDKFASERDWGRYHTPKNLAMALSVEASELLEIFQWLTPRESRKLAGAKLEHLREEIADVYVYLLRLASLYGIDVNLAAREKLKKNAVKYPIAKARGSARKYNEP